MIKGLVWNQTESCQPGKQIIVQDFLHNVSFCRLNKLPNFKPAPKENTLSILNLEYLKSRSVAISPVVDL